ncbi:hypothetical protein [Streptomyces sp. NPDC059788]|uniref:hypothetical protein n=1 Tax=Streptomyces sp. NPDC059788 TaxID=3346948 RepID=UPI003668681E
MVAALRRVVDDLAAGSYAIGELMLQVAPAYLSDTDASDVLALLCEETGKPFEHGRTARRYAMSGDRRALHETVLWTSDAGCSCVAHSPFPRPPVSEVRVRRGLAVTELLVVLAMVAAGRCPVQRSICMGRRHR